jgi:VanZ family protein
VLLRRLSLLSAIAWMGLLFYLSAQPGLDTPLLFPGQDKLFHALAYAVLGTLLLISLKPAVDGFTGTQVSAAALVASLYGISDEIHQLFVPGRSAEVADWLADALGALAATLLLAWLSRRLARTAARQST